MQRNDVDTNNVLKAVIVRGKGTVVSCGITEIMPTGRSECPVGCYWCQKI